MLSPMSDAWIESVKHAATPEELIQLSRRYIASWDGDSLANLPDDCKPATFASYEDVSVYAVTLVRRQFALEGTPEAAPVRRMAEFFAAASMRLAEILGAGRYRHSRAALLSFLEDE